MNKLMAEYKLRFLELIKISAPIIIEQFFITTMGMVITAMVSSTGDYAVAAVGMIDSVNNLLIAIFTALTTGCTIVTAQHFGREDHTGAAKTGAQSIIMIFSLSLVVSIVFAILRTQIITALFKSSDADVTNAGIDFLRIINLSFPLLAVTQTLFGVMRGCGDTGAPMLITLGMNFINFILGYILIIGINIFGIYTTGFGVTGAAAALVLARFCGMAAACVYIARMSNVIRLNKPSYFKLDFNVWRVVCRLGIPASIESALFQVGKLITQIFIVSLGAAALAANTVGSSVAALIYVPGNAFSIGVMILIGHRVGRRQESDIKKTSIFTIIIGAVMMGLICLICLPLTKTLTIAYNLSPEATQIFKDILLSALIAIPFFWPASFITPASLRATGDVNFTMAVTIISMWTFRIVIGYILGISMRLGVLGFWMGMYVDWLVRSLLFFQRLLSEKWKKRLEPS